MLNSRRSRNGNRAENSSTGTSWLAMSDHVAAALKTNTNIEASYTYCCLADLPTAF